MNDESCKKILTVLIVLARISASEMIQVQVLYSCAPNFAQEKKRMRRMSRTLRPRVCRFCRENIDLIDYKDLDALQKLTTRQGKLFSRNRSGNCATHQRMVKNALKRARFMGLMPYYGER